MPNQFETAILDAAVSAQKFHIEMAFGYYLKYSNESYLQNYIAIEVFKKHRFPTYIDASPKRIYEQPDLPSGIRFDLVFWFKSGYRPKAIFEIKRAWNKTPIINDVQKILDYRNENDDPDVTGYVLYYTHDDAQIISDRFRRVNDTMRNQLSIHGLTHPVEDYIFSDYNPPWGFALFRCCPR